MEEGIDWKPFPNPQEKGFIYAPFGPGVYELRRCDTKELVLRGAGKNRALRMTSLLPDPLGQGSRNNQVKREYVMDNLHLLEYRCYATKTTEEAFTLETKLHREAPCLFPK